MNGEDFVKKNLALPAPLPDLSPTFSCTGPESTQCYENARSVPLARKAAFITLLPLIGLYSCRMNPNVALRTAFYCSSGFNSGCKPEKATRFCCNPCPLSFSLKHGPFECNVRVNTFVKNLIRVRLQGFHRPGLPASSRMGLLFSMKIG